MLACATVEKKGKIAKGAPKAVWDRRTGILYYWQGRTREWEEEGGKISLSLWQNSTADPIGGFVVLFERQLDGVDDLSQTHGRVWR